MMAAYTTTRVGLGILFILVGSLAANLLDVTIRVMQQETLDGLKAFTGFEIMTVRTLWGFPLVIVFALIDAGFSRRRGGMGWQWCFPGYRIALLRSLLYLQISLGFFISLEYLSVGNVTLLFFIYPLFITLLSLPILGDSVGWWRGAAVLIGFVGIALVAAAIVQDPLTKAQSLQNHVPWWAIALPLWSGFMYAAAQILMRFIPQQVPGMMISLYTQGLAGLWCLLILLIARALWPDGGDIGAFSALSRSLQFPGILWGFVIFGGFSMALLSQAFRFAPAVILGPLDYVAVLGAYVFGYLILGDLPPTNSPLSLGCFAGGVVLILFSGLTIIYRELILKQPLAATTTAGEALNATGSKRDRL